MSKAKIKVCRLGWTHPQAALRSLATVWLSIYHGTKRSATNTSQPSHVLQMCMWVKDAVYFITDTAMCYDVLSAGIAMPTHKALSKQFLSKTFFFSTVTWFVKCLNKQEKLPNLFSLLCTWSAEGWRASKVAATQHSGVKPRGRRFKSCPGKLV